METKTVHQNNDQDKWEPIDFVLGMSGSKKIFYLYTLNYKVLLNKNTKIKHHIVSKM